MVTLTKYCKGVFLVFVIAGLQGSLFAQDISGSVYSVYGIGDLKWKGSALTRAMDGTGIAVRDEFNLNTANPAAYNAISSPVTKVFEFGGYVESNTFNSSAASTSFKSGTISSLNYWFKFSPKFAGVLGVAPLSSSSYNVSSNQAISAGASLIPVSYQGTGGFNQFYIGNSFQVFKNLSIGANVSLVLGSLVQKAVTSANIYSSALESDSKFFAKGENIDVGLQYFFNIKKSRFVFGSTFKTGTLLHGYKQIVLTTSTGLTQSTDPLVVNYTLPRQYGGGLSFIRNRFTMAADISFQEWKRAKLESNLVTQNIFRYSVGAEYRGTFETTNYLKTISFRAGFHLQDYYILVRNVPLRDWGYTIGAGLPLNGNFATLNLNYSSSNFGSTQNGLVQQLSTKYSVAIVIRDIWGIKRKFD